MNSTTEFTYRDKRRRSEAFIAQRDSFVRFSNLKRVMAAISERGVIYPYCIHILYNPRVAGNLHTKFRLNRFNRLSTKA